MGLIFEVGEALGEAFPLCAQLGPAFVDVPDELSVDVVRDFQAAYKALAPGLGLGDSPAHCGDLVGALGLGVLSSVFRLLSRRCRRYWPNTRVERKALSCSTSALSRTQTLGGCPSAR